MVADAKSRVKVESEEVYEAGFAAAQPRHTLQLRLRVITAFSDARPRGRAGLVRAAESYRGDRTLGVLLCVTPNEKGTREGGRPIVFEGPACHKAQSASGGLKRTVVKLYWRCVQIRSKRVEVTEKATAQVVDGHKNRECYHNRQQRHLFS